MARRISILADTHVGLAGPQPDGRTYGDAAPVLERAIGRIIEDPPDQAFFVGDIVNRGFGQEYTRAKRILGPLQRIFEPVLGNHELQRASVQDFETQWGVNAVRATFFSDFPAIVLNSGIEGLPDTQWHGVLDDVQLRLLEEQLFIHRDVPVFVFCHHPIAGTVRGSERSMLSLSNSAELQRVLERRTRPLVMISGHTHEADVVREGAVTYIGCPPLGFWPHAFLQAAVGSSSMEVQTIRVVDSPDESPDPRSRESGRERPAEEQVVTIPLT